MSGFRKAGTAGTNQLEIGLETSSLLEGNHEDGQKVSILQEDEQKRSWVLETRKRRATGHEIKNICKKTRLTEQKKNPRFNHQVSEINFSGW